MSIPLRTYFKASLRDASVHSWMLINFEASLRMLSSTCGLSCRGGFVETCTVYLNNFFYYDKYEHKPKIVLKK